MTSSTALLALIQLADSAVPIGGFSHSWGVETLVQRGELTNATQVLSYIRSLLFHSIGPQEGVACALAHRYQMERQFESFAKLNEILTASRWAAETLSASVSMGKRLIKLASDTGMLPVEPERLPAIVHHCSAFGWVGSATANPVADTVSAFLYSSCASLVSASVRLIPLGQTDGQKTLSELRPYIDVISEDCLQRDLDQIGAFAPLHEWASVEHETLYSRLFQS